MITIYKGCNHSPVVLPDELRNYTDTVTIFASKPEGKVSLSVIEPGLYINYDFDDLESAFAFLIDRLNVAAPAKE
jgi:hypothetical protein